MEDKQNQKGVRGCLVKKRWKIDGNMLRIVKILFTFKLNAIHEASLTVVYSV